MTDQQRYELTKIRLDAREIAAEGGYPFTVAMVQLAGENLQDGRQVVAVQLNSKIQEVTRITITTNALDHEGNVIVTPGGTAKSQWIHKKVDEVPKHGTRKATSTTPKV